MKKTPVRIWIDLGNSPHVPFFKALSSELSQGNVELLWTARDYAQTVELARAAGLDIEVAGRHGGGSIFGKTTRFLERVFALIKWSGSRQIDLLLSHNSQEPLVAARFLGIKSINMMDYEHHPANHLSFRMARRVFVPESFPDSAVQRFGVNENKVWKYPGIKEDVYLSNFSVDPDFARQLEKIGISHNDVLAVIRPHAPEALYHRSLENQLLDLTIDRLASIPGVKIILLPRKDYQGRDLKRRHPQPNVIIPETVLDGANLIAAADLVISGGGTMVREAAALGVPAFSIFVGEPAAVDQYLVSEGRLHSLRRKEDLDAILPVKRQRSARARRSDLRRQMAEQLMAFAGL